MSQYPTNPTTTNRIIVLCLYCPPLSESSTLVIPSGGEGKVDVGAVSRAFGLDPSTVRLNGHYLSRGPDLKSRSVTWAALLAYFVHKGLPAGRDGAVVVEGKSLRIGNKRRCEEGRGVEEGTCGVRGEGDGDFVRKRVKRGHSAHPPLRCSEAKESGGSCSKRKCCLLEDTSLLKRLTISDTPITEDRSDREGLVPPVASTLFECRVGRQNVKRVRYDDNIIASPLRWVR